MSRTIRRTEIHLIRWWLEEPVILKSRSAWRQHLLPGLKETKHESKQSRLMQTDAHQFHAGPERFQRKRWHRRYRQMTKLQLMQCEDPQLNPKLFYPYMF